MMKTLLVTVVAVVGLEFLVFAGQSDAPPSVFTAAQAAAGKASYESVCVNCHTYAVTGRKGDPGELPAISSLAETFRNGIQQARGKIPPLAGEAFVKRWGARTTQALSTRIATAIGGFPPTGLDDNTANNLAAYFLQVSGARAGTRELGTPGTTEVLIREVTATVAAR
jgi:mono/diheme cytochrome c family protein